MTVESNRSDNAASAGVWLEALWMVAAHFRLDGSKERVGMDAAWLAREWPLDELVQYMARQLGMGLVFDEYQPELLDPWRLPLIADLGDGQVGVIETVDGQGQVGLRLTGDGGLAIRLGTEELRQRVRRVARARPLVSVPDARVDEYIKPHEPHWFWSLVLKDWPRYLEVVVASLVANLLTVGAMLFTMQVYDRVIPAQSEPTLWVLYSGLLLVLSFALVMKVLRTWISDAAGKRADLRISDRVFGHALRIRSDARPPSTGTFIAQLRELEQVRDMVTSTTITALADLPFFLLFLVLLYWMSGSGAIVAVPLGAVLLLLVSGLLAQKPLARLSREGLREGALRNALLVEAIQGVDDIKLLRAEPRFQNQWNHANEVLAQNGMRQRLITSLLMNWTQEVQTLVYGTVVLVGAYEVMAGQMSTGVLVASSMLASRMVMPLAHLSSIMAKWQTARQAREGLDEMMKRPVDHPEVATRVHRPVLLGAYEFKSVRFQYDPGSSSPVLDIAQLRIAPGEKVALLGRNGAGKSTLLQLLSGLLAPSQGVVTLDGVRLSSIDPSDVRRDVALLAQNATLFHGTVRENLAMGFPLASDAELLRALQLSGADGFVNALPKGWDQVIQEGGAGLSGGQRQTLLLARTLLRQPHVLLLDEPTAWLDDASEKQVIEQMDTWLGQRTLVVATHRPAMLRCVDRVIVMDGGRIVADGPRDKVLVRRVSGQLKGESA